MCQGREQADFGKGFSIIDQMFILNQLVEKVKEYNMDLYFLFMDFQKAFDTIDHNILWEALKNQGIHRKYINIIKKLFEGAEVYIKTEGKGRNSR